MTTRRTKPAVGGLVPGKGLPARYQQALMETVADIDVVTELVHRRLDQEDIGRILVKLGARGEDAFIDNLSGLVRKTSALLLVARRLSDSLSLDVLLPRMVELISEFLDAERCTIFLYDPATDELFTKAAVGLSAEIRIPADRGIAGTVFRTGRPLLIAEAYADPRFNPEIDQQTGFLTRNILCVPLRHQGEAETRTVGAVQVLNKRGGPFTGDDLKLLDTLNSQAAAAFVNALLHQEIARAKTQELELLEVTTALSSELHLQPLLEKIMAAVAALVEAERATLFLHDARGNTLWALADGGQEIRFPAHLGIAGHVFTTGEVIHIADAYADPRFNREVDVRTGFRTRDILCAPVVDRAGRTIGVTQVLNKKRGGFTPMDEKRLMAFTAEASVAMQNAQLFEEVDRIRRYNESVLEGITNGVITVSPAGRVVKANTAALRLLGRLGAPEAVVDQAVRVFFRDRNEWIADAVEAVTGNGEPVVAMDADLALEADAVRDGVKSMAVNLAVLPLPEGRDRPPGCILMIEDITREKRLKTAFSRYMSKEVAERLLEQGESALEGRLQKATILFSDIRSFTSLSERIGPQETVRLLNEYFGLMADIVLEKGGLLDKYIGDAIMAVFGVPLPGPRDADLAVEAAVEMFRALRGFNARRAAAGRDPVAMGVGINTDEVVSGNIGSQKRMDYTVIGDGVNLASRLEGANRHYGTQLLLSELTARELKGPFLLREVDRMRVRGKIHPVAVFEVLDHLPDGDPARDTRFLNLYQAGLEAYRRREWAAARKAFDAASRLHPGDALTRLYRQRAAGFTRRPPPEDWDGVAEMKDK